MADELDPGPAPRLWTGDTTAERLEDLLAEHRGRFAVMSDEGGVLSTLGRYNGKGDANLDVLLHGWDGGRLDVERRSRRAIVDSVHLSAADCFSRGSCASSPSASTPPAGCRRGSSMTGRGRGSATAG